ncbi:hypothetical protein HN011_008164 [Eciton burchellii]|nr:hypothetical protein HN011_008164 [Eciton burchellii]
MYYRKSSTARPGCLITVPPSVEHFGNLGVPFNPLRSYIPSRRNSYPDALLSNGCQRKDGIARGARTSAGNNFSKRWHIERTEESLPEKSMVRHAGDREKVERARGTHTSNVECRTRDVSST